MPMLSRLLVIAALLLNASAVAHSQTASKEAKETSAITGRVTTHGDEPLPGLGLILIPARFSRDRQKPVGRATTGADGFYRMANVPPGSYRLQVLAAAHTFADASAVAFVELRDGLAINVAAGETIENQDFTLARGGVITGRVTDTDGKPLIGEYIRLISPADDNGRPGAGGEILPYSFETDDRGVYRVYGLPAGRYLVSVGEDKEGRIVRGAFSGKNITRTFHPDAPEEAQAQVVEVSAGGEAKDIDITLAPPPKTYEATGHALDAETGKPVAGLFYGFGVLRAGDREMGHRGYLNTKTNADGEFSLKNLLPGRYAVFIHSRDGDAHGHYSDAAPFEITDSNVGGLVLKVRRAATLSGVVVVEGTKLDRATLAKLSQITFYLSMRPGESKSDELHMSNTSQVRLQADGSFRVTGLPPGKAHFKLQEFNAPKGFTLLRVERGGVEQSGGIEVGAGEQVTDVRLHLAYGASVLRGQVEVRRDGATAQLPAGGRVWVSLRPLSANSSSRDGYGAEVDGRGRFIIEGLIAGEYELMTNVWIQSAPGARPGTPLPTARQTINVPEKGETSVTVVYDLNVKPQQTRTTP